MFGSLGKPHARVEVHYPKVKGCGAVTKFADIAEVFDKFKTVDLIVLCVDRDGDTHRRNALDNLEARVRRELAQPPYLLATRTNITSNRSFRPAA